MIGKRERGNLSHVQYTLSTQMNGVKEKISSVRSKTGKKKKVKSQTKKDSTTNDERTERITNARQRSDLDTFLCIAIISRRMHHTHTANHKIKKAAVESTITTLLDFLWLLVAAKFFNIRIRQHLRTGSKRTLFSSDSSLRPQPLSIKDIALWRSWHVQWYSRTLPCRIFFSDPIWRDVYASSSHCQP